MMVTLPPFVDAHVHFWDLDKLPYPWLTPPFTASSVNGDVSPIARTYLPGDYLDDAGAWSPIAVVHVDAGAAPSAALAETQWLESLDSGTLLRGIVGFAPLDNPDVEALLEAQAASSRMRGIRHIANWHPDPFFSYTPRNLLEDPAWLRGVGCLARHGLSLDLQIYPNQFDFAADLAGRNPNLGIILNHAGMPIDRSAEGLAAWRDGLRKLASHPNVAVKISGLGIVDHGWTEESIRPLVLDVIALFGVERCMFASDFPTDKLYAGFGAVLDAFNEIVSDFSEDERTALFAANADRIYRLGLGL